MISFRSLKQLIDLKSENEKASRRNRDDKLSGKEKKNTEGVRRRSGRKEKTKSVKCCGEKSKTVKFGRRKVTASVIFQMNPKNIKLLILTTFWIKYELANLISSTTY